MSFLVDTNILLRSVEPLHPHHAVAVAAVYRLLAESTPVYFNAEWKRIIVVHGVSGVKVHDARLVATMKTHGVRSLLTFDMDDFKRYTGIDVMHPKVVAA
jgi:predicted nucleic acid-binding protein